MKTEPTGHDFAVQKGARRGSRLASLPLRLCLIAIAGTILAALLAQDPHAQQRYREPTVRVTGVTTSGNVVSIAADGSLGRAQTWQDAEGFHVVLVNGEYAAGGARGVRTQRVGNSLELIVPVKRGATVTVQPRGNRLDLVVAGGTGGALSVENFPVESPAQPERAEVRRGAATRTPTADEVLSRVEHSREESRRRAAPEMIQPEPQPSAESRAQAQAPPPAPAPTAAPVQADAAPQNDAVGSLGPAPQGVPPAVIAQPAAAKAGKVKKSGGLLSFVLSLPSLFALLGVGLAGAVVLLFRRKRSGGEDALPALPKSVRAGAAVAEKSDAKSEKPFEQPRGDRRKVDLAVPFERRRTGQGAEDEVTRSTREDAKAPRASESRAQYATTAVVFGAYRIDQEVASLVGGGPHSTEVLSSRASDDRRAVETSLLKALRAPETDEDGRRRARTALEDYGFVARSCAGLLLGAETFERVSAARALGDMRSAQALPFLTEALYDPDPLVRTECVQSLGALGLPSAIGALLDVARRHRDIPAAVIGPALTACSVESLELAWDSPAAARPRAEAREAEASGADVRGLVPVVEYEDLPETAADESALAGLLVRVESTDAESRVSAAQHLAQFQVRSAVRALARAAQHDAEPAVRSAAVNSLGLINHESVFAYVIIALADEAREVRAAAARALSRLSFERADAYVRLAETADSRTLRDVAHACVKAGLAAQAVTRLSSEDRRQAYEAFSLLSLCVGGGEAQPLVEAVESHDDIDARLTCIQLLGDAAGPEVCEQLKQLASAIHVPERVRRSILETVERSARAQEVPVA